MRLRQMAVAFLFNEAGEMLFLQKKSGSRFLGGHLVPIGGHVEEGEFGDPRQACVREIAEETGLAEPDVGGLKLRYIINRLKAGQEIRIQYIFMGIVASGSRLVSGEEGELLWLEAGKLDGMHVTASTRAVLQHYFEHAVHNESIFTGTMHSLQGEPAMAWSVLEDWED
ncbi:NUDIX hydrolase [Paenibacillus typhae]|uniref:8-oxo-dGTP diphosphatase n=1 Tax=Paenibacillus typhae TaxID=1174501 RepID=A0A1G8VGM7_9BACL|nr:NUDIX hydrolase [Paenibacillus typhae]SDJ65064.1 8-oxo-dGTP diphosphatase [Paenibacillus typhae]